jgi:heme oxygenase
MTLVRSAISASHFQIEQTAFSKGMMDGSMNPLDYSRGLVQLWHIHFALERSVAKCPEVTTFFTPEMIRTATIQRDLQAFGFDKNHFAPLEETNIIVEQIQAWERNSPYALLGCVYILEGSRMGSLVIAKPLGRSLGLPAGTTAGLEYHTEGALSTPMRLRSFKEKVDTAGFDARSESELIEGAVNFMEMLNNLYQALPVNANNAAKTPSTEPTIHPLKSA